MAKSRRNFLKTGALAALVLAAGGAVYRCTRASAQADRFVLDGQARAALDAIVPAMLGNALLHPAAIALATERVHQAILGLPLSAQKELQDLFGLLALAPARRWLAGVPADWPGATAQQVGAFLQDWRLHRFAMVQSAYHALHDLVLGSWYADPSTWQSIGYPGPPKELS